MSIPSLRPLSLGPGPPGTLGPGGAFSAFAAGAGAALRASAETSTAAPVERVKKPASEIVRYDRDQLLAIGKVRRGQDCVRRRRSANRARSGRRPAPAGVACFPPSRCGPTPAPRAPEWIVSEPRSGGQGLASAAPGPKEARLPTRVFFVPCSLTAPPSPTLQTPAAATSTADGIAATLASVAPDIVFDPSSEEAVRAAASAAGGAGEGAVVAEDGRDWRSRADAPTSAATPGPPTADAPAILRAADQGRVAWAPASGGDADADAKALKAAKGILNKLTPEKFDRLTEQLLALITTPAVLVGATRLVFDAAAAQPTFVATYADLCASLAPRVPEFADPATPDAAPVTFRRVLLNTCQEEFEGAASARAALGPVAAAADTADARRVKARTLGCVRLIAELFNKGVVAEKIVHVCVRDLLATPSGGAAGSDPPPDALEAVCEMLTLAGRKLDAPDAKSAAALEGYMATVARLASSMALPSRVRFMLRDVSDLRAARWVPRRAAPTAKKLADVHADAAAELGMAVPPALLPVVAGLPALPAGLLAGAPPDDDVDLFPAFRGADDAFAKVGTRQATEKVGGATVASAFLGEYEELPAAAPRPAAGAAGAVGAATAATPSAPAASTRGPQSDADRASLSKSLYSDYLATASLADAEATARELLEGAPPSFPADLVATGIDRAFDEPKPEDAASVASLVGALAAAGALPAGAFVEGVRRYTETIDDLALDVPKAPALLGASIGAALAGGAIEGGALASLLDGVESVDAKRGVVASALAAVAKSDGGDAAVAAAATAADLPALLQADPEFDPPDTPSVDAFLKGKGLAAAIV